MRLSAFSGSAIFLDENKSWIGGAKHNFPPRRIAFERFGEFVHVLETGEPLILSFLPASGIREHDDVRGWPACLMTFAAEQAKNEPLGEGSRPLPAARVGSLECRPFDGSS